jgi:cytoskeletal protein CcmA (bactofilin family)
MFQKKSPPPQQALTVRPQTEPARAANVPSIVAADMEFRGDIVGAGDLQIDGKVIGKVHVGHLVIADGGSVEGDIVAKAVRISGVLNGTVQANVVSLTATARVHGDLLHDTLEIAAGAQLEGACRRMPLAPTGDPHLSTTVLEAAD